MYTVLCVAETGLRAVDLDDEVCTGLAGRTVRVAAWRRARVYRPPYRARRGAREIAPRGGAAAPRVCARDQTSRRETSTRSRGARARGRGVLRVGSVIVILFSSSGRGLFYKGTLTPIAFLTQNQAPGTVTAERHRQHSSKHLRLDAAGLLQPALGERRGELNALVHKALDSAGTGSLQLGVQVSSSV